MSGRPGPKPNSRIQMREGPDWAALEGKTRREGKREKEQEHLDREDLAVTNLRIMGCLTPEVHNVTRSSTVHHDARLRDMTKRSLIPCHLSGYTDDTD